MFDLQRVPLEKTQENDRRQKGNKSKSLREPLYIPPMRMWAAQICDEIARRPVGNKIIAKHSKI
jgi:hypothetical protein